MNLARKIMWCLCLGVWLALVTVLCTSGLRVAHLIDDWRYLLYGNLSEATLLHEQTSNPFAKAACLAILRESRRPELIVESARRAADSGWKEAIPLLRQLFYNETVLGEAGMLKAIFVPLCRLEGRPIDRLEQARVNIQDSYSAPGFPWICPNPARFSRYPAKTFILRCQDTEAAAFVAIELAYLTSKCQDNRGAIEHEGRRLLSQLPREAAQPLLKRIRSGMGKNAQPESRQTVDMLHRICGTRHSGLHQRGPGVCLLMFEFVLGVGLVCLGLGFLGFLCIVDCCRRKAHQSQPQGPVGEPCLKLCFTHAGSCIALVVACWAPVAARLWVMLGLAHLGVQRSPLLARATQSPIYDITFALALVSTPALLCEGSILHSLRRRERETKLGAR